MEITSYILPELMILIPVLYAIGYVLKKNAKVPDENIPLILCGTGVILAFIYLLSVSELTNTQQWGSLIFAAITQGILCAAAAVGLNQVVKQSEKAVVQATEDEEYYNALDSIVADYEKLKTAENAITEEEPKSEEAKTHPANEDPLYNDHDE